MKTFSITDIGQKRSSNQDYVFPLSSRLVICQIFSLLQMEWEDIKREIMLPDIR